jgi:Tfp pilus assembly protein PilN
MRAVNLLPLEARVGRRRPPAAALGVAGFAVLAATVLAVGFFSAHGKVDSREQELASLEQQLAASRAAAQPDPTQTNLNTERDQRFTALGGAMSERLAWDRILREVSLVLPDDVWLSSLAAGGATAAAGTEAATPEAATPEAVPGRSVTFNGFTYSQESVARLLRRLTLVPDLADVKLAKSSVTTVGTQQIYNFSVLANVASEGGNP